MTYQAGDEVGGSNKEVESLSTLPRTSWPWRSVEEFIDGCGNSRVDTFRLAVKRPQHGHRGKALFTAVNDADGRGPRALTWRIGTNDRDWSLITDITTAAIHHLRYPFM